MSTPTPLVDTELPVRVVPHRRRRYLHTIEFFFVRFEKCDYVAIDVDFEQDLLAAAFVFLRQGFDFCDFLLDRSAFEVF